MSFQIINDQFNQPYIEKNTYQLIDKIDFFQIPQSKNPTPLYHPIGSYPIRFGFSGNIHPDSLKNSAIRIDMLFSKNFGNIGSAFLAVKIEATIRHSTSYEYVELIKLTKNSSFPIKFCVNDSGHLCKSLLFSYSENEYQNGLKKSGYDNLKKILEGEDVIVEHEFQNVDISNHTRLGSNHFFSSDEENISFRLIKSTDDDLIYEKEQEERLNFALIQHNSAFTNIETSKKTYTFFKSFIF